MTGSRRSVWGEGEWVGGWVGWAGGWDVYAAAPYPHIGDDGLAAFCLERGWVGG